MIVRVMLDKKLLADFRKQAIKAYPNEVMNTLWGRAEGDSIIIHRMRSVEQDADENKVEAYVSDMVSPVATTADRYLGSIHSHPDCHDASPSVQDWHNAYVCGEHVFGVMSVMKSDSGRFSTAVSWWEPRPFIDTIHPRIRKPSWNQTKAISPSEPTSPATLETSPSPGRVQDAGTVSISTESQSTATTQSSEATSKSRPTTKDTR